MQSYLALFAEICFPALFGGHLEFLCKMQKCIYLGNGVRWSDFEKIFGPQGIHRVICHFSPKIVFLQFLATILNFCINCTNAYTSKTVQDRAISMKVLAHRVYPESATTFCETLFPIIFGGHLEFLRKNAQTLIYLRNGAR